jgi:hypothetical protein
MLRPTCTIDASIRAARTRQCYLAKTVLARVLDHKSKGNFEPQAMRAQAAPCRYHTYCEHLSDCVLTCVGIAGVLSCHGCHGYDAIGRPSSSVRMYGFRDSIYFTVRVQ